MLSRFYYELKPYMPWRVRMALRRFTAGRKRAASAHVWPIDPTAGARPAAWSGWPDGRQFALVLTHDVEGPDGLAKCQRLAELEMELGFRSSFNFIPEGSYSVTPTLRKWLTDRGFEVGVHDLHHDGKLFRSRQGFQRKAQRINEYIREWNSAGFRSGFMLRNLDWIHDLEIQYDSSTFDTDPFELQPDGAGTIFPFRTTPPQPFHSPLARAPRPGYIELPYTLPQDSTLFLVLREKTPDIWLRKTDWIAEHGGMALVNVHPDYVHFGADGTSREYSIEMYSAFLRHVSQTYRDRVWNPTPREMAAWFNRVHPAQPQRIAVPARPAHSGGQKHRARANGLRGRRAAVLLYSTYPSDPRPRRATETLIEAGFEVDLLCLSEGTHEPLRERVGDVEVHRVPLKHRRDSKRTYLWQYGRFFVSAFWFLARRGLRRRYDLVHVHNMPDFLVFSALVPKLRGAMIVLDLHDPMPELMMTIFGTHEHSFGIWVLKRLEKWSIGFSDAVITVNEACRRLFSVRSSSPEKINVVMNSPDERIFRFRPLDREEGVRTKSNQRFVIMYHGSLVERHGLDLAVHALTKLRLSVPGALLWVFGQETPFLKRVMTMVESSGLRGCVQYFGPKKLEQIVEAIDACDIGIIPNRRSIFTEINTPTRIFEYLSQAKPVIAPQARGILDYFGADDLIYFELGNADDLAAKLEYAFRQPEEVADTVRRGQQVYRQHNWENERRRFLMLVTNLVGAHEPAGAASAVPAVTATTEP